MGLTFERVQHLPTGRAQLVTYSQHFTQQRVYTHVAPQSRYSERSKNIVCD